MIAYIKGLLLKFSIYRQQRALQKDIDKVTKLLSSIENNTKPKRVIRNGRLTIE